jgi:hypothetical protein
MGSAEQLQTLYRDLKIHLIYSVGMSQWVGLAYSMLDPKVTKKYGHKIFPLHYITLCFINISKIQDLSNDSCIWNMSREYIFISFTQHHHLQVNNNN